LSFSKKNFLQFSFKTEKKFILEKISISTRSGEKWSDIALFSIILIAPINKAGKVKNNSSDSRYKLNLLNSISSKNIIIFEPSGGQIIIKFCFYLETFTEELHLSKSYLHSKSKILLRFFWYETKFEGTWEGIQTGKTGKS
jgi:hypothetical protein